MTADVVFQVTNGLALCGWLVLVFAVVRKNDWLRDHLAGFWWPIALGLLYAAIVVSTFGQADGGFDSLAHVKRLFASDWALLAGWIHYLAFDLFIGAWIARDAATKGLSRWWLLPIWPATFLFGPIGLLAFGIVRQWKARPTTVAVREVQQSTM